MGRHRSLIGGLLFAAAAMASAQSFDVASIQVNRIPVDPGATSSSDVRIAGPGHVQAINANLRECIEWAYHPREDQLSGPDWLNDNRPSFFIEAKAPPETLAPELRRMMQTLLADRFGLKLRRETKVVPAYELVVAKGGPKLPPIKPDPPPGFISPGGGRVRAGAVTAGQLARALGSELKRLVFDKTGIDRRFSFELDYAPEGDTVTGRPSLFTALEKSLGLKLTAARAPVEHLVVEHAERIPTEN